MTELQAVEYIHSLPRMTGGPTLERMKALMARLGDPQKGLKCIHVAGTNGKGTVSVLTASILKEAMLPPLTPEYIKGLFRGLTLADISFIRKKCNAGFIRLTASYIASQ